MNPEETPFRTEERLELRSDLLISRPLGHRPDHGGSAAPRPQHWYALYTRSRYEKVVDRLLAEKGFETFLPLTVKRSPVSFRRFREAEIPLFPGYTFARFCASHEDLHEVRATTGVASIVGSRAGPILVPDAEIESVKTLLAQKVSWSLSSTFALGQRVIVTGGPLQGVQGEIVRRKNRQLFVVKIQLIRRMLEVAVSPLDLEVVRTERPL